MSCTLSPRPTMVHSACPNAPRKRKFECENGRLYACCKRACKLDDNMLPSLLGAVRQATSIQSFDAFKEQLRNEMYLKSMDEFDMHALRDVYELRATLV